MGKTYALEPVPNTPPVRKGFASAIMTEVIIIVILVPIDIIANIAKEVFIQNYMQVTCKFMANAEPTQVEPISLETMLSAAITTNNLSPAMIYKTSPQAKRHKPSLL